MAFAEGVTWTIFNHFHKTMEAVVVSIAVIVEDITTVHHVIMAAVVVSMAVVVEVITAAYQVVMVVAELYDTVLVEKGMTYD